MRGQGAFPIPSSVAPISAAAAGILYNYYIRIYGYGYPVSFRACPAHAERAPAPLYLILVYYSAARAGAVRVDTQPSVRVPASAGCLC
jgi:hypothetical protein